MKRNFVKKDYPFIGFVYINIFPRLSGSGQSSPTVSPSTPAPPPTTTAQEYGNCPGNLIVLLSCSLKTNLDIDRHLIYTQPIDIYSLHACFF